MDSLKDLLKQIEAAKKARDFVRQFELELQLSIETALSSNKSQAELQRDIKKYMKDPNKLFRDMAEKKGTERAVQAENLYKRSKTGYNSSIKNADSFIRNSMNTGFKMSRQSDWINMPIVVGQLIKLGQNENHCLMCVAIVGKYPKDFIFNKFHLNCYCTSTPILKTQKEMERDFERAKRGLKPISIKKSENYVASPPKAFDTYVSENMDRLLKAQSKKTLNYVFRDNKKYWEG